jgi:DNA primase
MESIAHDPQQRTAEVARPERRGVARQTVVDAAKEAVTSLDLADLLCGPGQMRRVGDRWVGRCPLPSHDDRSPSFTVYSQTDSFFCFGCLIGGDVIELARHAYGYDKDEVALAAAQLLVEFGHEIPQRPASWHRRQSRQDQVRRALKEAQARRVQRRLYRWILAPALADIADEDERLVEAGHAWEDAGKIARQIVARAGGA